VLPYVRPSSLHDSSLGWDSVPLKAYKPEGTHFKDNTRQVLFEEGMPVQVRYFEIEPGGYSSFEKHEHVHAVMVLQGEGRVLVGNEVFTLRPHDLVYIPPATWHQFFAAEHLPLGFLCLVDCDRDRPVRPSHDEQLAIRNHPIIGQAARF
jgi:quercetin dioxygenase-like cupin family protein